MQKLIDAGASLNIPDAVRTFVCTYIHAFLHNKYSISYILFSSMAIYTRREQLQSH